MDDKKGEHTKPAGVGEDWIGLKANLPAIVFSVGMAVLICLLSWAFS